MNVNWDAMNQAARANRDRDADERARRIAREEASKIITGVMTGLHEKIMSSRDAAHGVDAVRCLSMVAGSIQDTIRDVQILGYDTDPPAAVSRPRGDTVDLRVPEGVNRPYTGPGDTTGGHS